MRAVIVSAAAEEDIQAILHWANQHFGARALGRYETLLSQAMLDLAENPTRTGSHDRPEIALSARSYHLVHSRKRVSRSVGRVKKPRHFILFRARGDDSLEISRVLHDSMELAEHIPVDFHEYCHFRLQ